MSVRVGSALVICPGCGKSFDMEVFLIEVKFGYERLAARFGGSSVQHVCEGRDE